MLYNKIKFATKNLLGHSDTVLNIDKTNKIKNTISRNIQNTETVVRPQFSDYYVTSFNSKDFFEHHKYQFSFGQTDLS